MRPDLYRPPPTKPGRGRGHHWPGGGGGFLKLVLVLAVLGGAGTFGWKKWGPSLAVAVPRSKWLYDLSDGISAGAAADKRILVLYTADGNEACQQLEADVLSEPWVRAYLSREFVRVRIDLTDPESPNSQLAAQQRIKSLPTIVVYDPGGAVVTRISGAAIGSWIRRQAEVK
jgi:thiol:disulfide interchange protein